jgi:nitrite reductase/ring-hydroxylating ferredoxin subunit
MTAMTYQNVPDAGVFLCRLEDIPNPGGREFVFGDPPTPFEMFVVRKGSEVWGYFNSCPHTGSPLNWTPGNFLDPSRTLIQCATHGAQFNLDDGACVSGPCPGSRLTPVPVVVNDGNILIAEPSIS